MAKINLTLEHTIVNGETVTFQAPCDCTAVTGLRVTYPTETGLETAEFCFRDTHNNDLSGLGNLFAEGAVVKAVLRTETGCAYIQNADTNGYLEARFRTIKEQIAIFDTPGEHTWICPDDVSVVEVLLAGGGQGGGYGSNSSSTGGYGGNGGEVIVKTLHVTPGESYLFSIGAGGVAATSADVGGVGENTTAFGLVARGGSRSDNIGAMGASWYTYSGSLSESTLSGAHGVLNTYDGWYYGCGGGGGSPYGQRERRPYPGGLSHQNRGRGGIGALSSSDGVEYRVHAENGQPGGGGGGGGKQQYNGYGGNPGNGGCGIVIIYAGITPFPSGGVVATSGDDPDVPSGVVFTPSVSSEGVISWTNNGGLSNPPPVNIKGPKGDTGAPGPAYTLTEADKTEMVAAVVAALPVYNGEVVTE